MKKSSFLEQFQKDFYDFIERGHKLANDLRIIDFEFNMQRDNPKQWQALLDNGYQPIHLKEKGEKKNGR